MKTATFTGHRPQFFNNVYDIQNKLYKPIIEQITNTSEDLIKQGVTKFISGSALGIDTIAFFCIHKLKAKYPDLKNILAIPYECQGSNWNENDIKWLNMMKQLADEVVYVDELERYKVGRAGTYNPKKLNKRNEYMVDESDFVIAVWSGEKSGTKNCIGYALTQNKTIKYIYITKGENTMKITRTEFNEAFALQTKALTELYENKTKGVEVEGVTDIISKLISIVDETGKQQVEFNEKSPLEKVLKEACDVVEISEDEKVIKFKETDGELSVVINI